MKKWLSSAHCLQNFTGEKGKGGMATLEQGSAAKHPRLLELIQLFRERHPEVVAQVAPTEHGYVGFGGRRLLSPLSKKRLEKVLGYMLDEGEFLSPFGIRSLSRYHLDHPFVFNVNEQPFSVSYLPAESNTGMFGGNSNWRGPIWMPVNALIVRGLLNLYFLYGDDFTVECPTGSGIQMTLFEVAQDITRRLASIFHARPEWKAAGLSHGYRAKHVYHYYPNAFVYFDVSSQVYFYLEVACRKTALVLPDVYRVKSVDIEYVSVDLDDDKPYNHFEAHKKKYPPGHAKKKGKKK